MLTGKYEFLLALRLLEYEIRMLNEYALECKECFQLLQNKLDFLSGFVVSEQGRQQWKDWGAEHDVQHLTTGVRETSAKALCDVEKYQSRRIYDQHLNISKYSVNLTNTVKQEIRQFNITEQSKVLFIGSGALPLSAITLANETGAEVMCLDTDPEAIDLSERAAGRTSCRGPLYFSTRKSTELPFTKTATHIYIASLVKDKLDVLDHLSQVVNKKVKIMIRYGNGIKSLFNYPWDDQHIRLQSWKQTPIHLSNRIYDTVILEYRQEV